MNGPEPKSRLVVGLGELLWDLFSEGRRLGGAPANFAVMAGRLGNRAVILSRIGGDWTGRDAQGTLSTFPVDLSHLQVDAEHATGSVSVKLTGGQPSYTIHEPVAWDFLDFTPEWRRLAARADAVCFGTLAQRRETSRRTIQSFLAATSPDCLRLFDVNLREPFYTQEVVEQSIERATILKMNDGEVAMILRLLGLPEQQETRPTEDSLLAAAARLLAEFRLGLVCITRGGQGSILATREATHTHPGVAATVADAVGAGDAFAAALMHYYLQGAPLPVLNEAGNRWGAWIASQSGAMPPLPGRVAASLHRQIALAGN